MRGGAAFYSHYRKRKHGHMRNIVYFKDKNKATINSKVMLQYYINRKKCGDKEKLKYTVQNPFLQLTHFSPMSHFYTALVF